MDLVERADSTFTKPELERLAAYRAAIEAGFYTDWDGSAANKTDTDTELLAWLRPVGAAANGGAYPFTADERQRLERIRAAVGGGDYADDQPPAQRQAQAGAEASATPDEPAR